MTKYLIQLTVTQPDGAIAALIGAASGFVVGVCLVCLAAIFRKDITAEQAGFIIGLFVVCGAVVGGLAS